jgi:hypothetical protein
LAWLGSHPIGASSDSLGDMVLRSRPTRLVVRHPAIWS